MIPWVSGLKPRVVLFVVAIAVGAGSTWAIVNRIDNALGDAYDQGRKDVLLEMREATADLRDRIGEADKGSGDASEDHDWILRQLDDLGVQLDDADGDAPASP